MKAIVLRKNYTEFKVYNIVPDDKVYKELRKAYEHTSGTLYTIPIDEFIINDNFVINKKDLLTYNIYAIVRDENYLEEGKLPYCLAAMDPNQYVIIDKDLIEGGIKNYNQVSWYVGDLETTFESIEDAENAFKELGINKYLIYDR